MALERNYKMTSGKSVFYALAVGVCTLGSLVVANPASAQTVNSQARQKSNWHESPHEIQIIDERPVIRDFREAPSAPQQVQLPPPPQGFGGGFGGGSNGALSSGGPAIPAGGIPLAGNGPGYRTAPAGAMGALPQSGFGRGSNIPAGGIGPKGPLADGRSTGNLQGKMLTPQKTAGSGAGAPRGMAPSSGRTNGNSNAPVASYSGGYGTGSGAGYGGAASRTDTAVRGTLLKR
jgi:hypothetical protein